MSISKQDIHYCAKLSALNLEHELERKKSQGHDNLDPESLGSALENIFNLAALDLSTIAPTAQIYQPQAPMRADEVGPSIGTTAALANAPDKESDHFLVPKVIKVKRS